MTDDFYDDDHYDDSDRYDYPDEAPSIHSRIASIVLDGNTELNLSREYMAHLPDDIGTLIGYAFGDKDDIESDWLKQFANITEFNLRHNCLVVLPEWIGSLRELVSLNLDDNSIERLPKSISSLNRLVHFSASSNKLRKFPDQLKTLDQIWHLDLSDNNISHVPEWIGQLRNLRELILTENCIKSIPESIGQLKHLEYLDLEYNDLTSLPSVLGSLGNLKHIYADHNQFEPELEAATQEGSDAVLRYLRSKFTAEKIFNEAKLILVGEGAVGKSCLLDALRDDPWQEHPTTHGIRLAQVNLKSADSEQDIVLNGWDFGGQKVYRPTHQLFFSSPAVYLVVWKPRDGVHAGQVAEWIRLIKHRESSAKVIVVATHGGPKQRQPDIDAHELQVEFGNDTLVGFHHVDSRPADSEIAPKQTSRLERIGIAALKAEIAKTAISLPDFGEAVPTTWYDAREAISKQSKSWMRFEEFKDFCVIKGMKPDDVDLFARLSHRLGHLIHYDYDPLLSDIVILRPDWLATAISLVLDDAETRANQGLVTKERLHLIWNDPERSQEERYPNELHDVFLKLMERFDLSYKVEMPGPAHTSTYLIAQLVSDVRPEELPNWQDNLRDGEREQTQICQITNDEGKSAVAEGLFFQLIVRLHRYSLGRNNYFESVHWKRGLMLDRNYHGRALMEHIGNDIRITVRAAYPESFLAILTEEVQWLIENFWEGLRCQVTIPCVAPCGLGTPGKGQFEVEKLIKSFGKNKTYPCPYHDCTEWQDIERLLRTSTANTASTKELLESSFKQIDAKLNDISDQIESGNVAVEALKSRIDDQFEAHMRALSDEAKDGPRLFSWEPKNPNGILGRLRSKGIETFRIALWCEHSRQPLTALNDDPNSGVYEVEIPREWFVNAASFFRKTNAVLSLVLPLVSSGANMLLPKEIYEEIGTQLDKNSQLISNLVDAGEGGTNHPISTAGSLKDGSNRELGARGPSLAKGSRLRQFHALLKSVDPTDTYGGLIRAQNKRQEFVWIHPQFQGEY